MIEPSPADDIEILRMKLQCAEAEIAELREAVAVSDALSRRAMMYLTEVYLGLLDITGAPEGLADEDA